MSKNLSADYYQENKEILSRKAYQEEKEKKQYSRECYKYLSEHEKINWLRIEKDIIK